MIPIKFVCVSIIIQIEIESFNRCFIEKLIFKGFNENVFIELLKAHSADVSNVLIYRNNFFLNRQKSFNFI